MTAYVNLLLLPLAMAEGPITVIGYGNGSDLIQ